MPNFYSPTGNFEVWETKPDGYYTVEEWQAMHPAPLPTLEEVKTNKIAEFKALRDSEEIADIEYNGNIYDYDDKARERLQIARQSIADSGVEGASIVWTTADNQRVVLTVQDFAGINTAVAYRSNVLHIKYNELKAQINACTTVEEVEAIKWENDNV